MADLAVLALPEVVVDLAVLSQLAVLAQSLVLALPEVVALLEVVAELAVEEVSVERSTGRSQPQW